MGGEERADVPNRRGPGSRRNPTKFCNGRKSGWRATVAGELGFLEGINRESDPRAWDRALRRPEVDKAHPKIPAGDGLAQSRSRFPELYCRSTPGAGTQNGGRGRCKTHGGKTPMGSGNPAYVHGRRAQVGWIRDALESTEFERDVTDLTRQIKVWWLLEEELLRTLETLDDTPELRAEASRGVHDMRQAREDLLSAINTSDLKLMDRAMDRMDGAEARLSDVLERAELKSDHLRELRVIQDHVRKLALAKNRIDARALGVMTRQEAHEFVQVIYRACCGALEEIFDDPDDIRRARALVATSFQQAVGAPAPGERVGAAASVGA